jgi:hypothetical protein
VPENPEQLKSLLGSFLDPESAKKAAEDIGRGLDLFRTHPAPAPCPERIASIKRDLHSRLAQARPPRRILTWIGWTATAAAVLLAITLLTLTYGPQFHPTQQVTEAVNPAQWNIDIPPVLSGMERELVGELNTILTINPDQYYSDSPDPIENLQQELKLMASTDDFWKG